MKAYWIGMLIRAGLLGLLSLPAQIAPPTPTNS